MGPSGSFIQLAAGRRWNCGRSGSWASAELLSAGDAHLGADSVAAPAASPAMKVRRERFRMGPRGFHFTQNRGAYGPGLGSPIYNEGHEGTRRRAFQTFGHICPGCFFALLCAICETEHSSPWVKSTFSPRL